MVRRDHLHLFYVLGIKKTSPILLKPSVYRRLAHIPEREQGDRFA